MVRTRSIAGALLVSLLPLLFASVPKIARADGEDAAAAEGLFQEGRRLETAGNFKDACPKFLASQKASPAVGTLLNLGSCYEKLGLTASAWARYHEAMSAAQRANRPDREKTARDRAQRLEPKLAHLTVSAKDAQIEVRRDDVLLDEGALGSPVPIDAGTHTITARAAGKKPFSKTITIADAQNQTFAIPALEDAPHAAEPPAPKKDSISTSAAANGGTSGLRVVSYIVFGLGLAGIGVGSYFGAQTFSSWSAAQGHCVGTVCDSSGVSLASDAHSQATISTVSFAAGGALLVGGVIMFFASSPSSGKSGLIVTPSVGSSYAGISIGGRL